MLKIFFRRRKALLNSQVMAEKVYGMNFPFIENLEKTMDLVLVNSHPSMEITAPKLPGVVHVGGMQIKEPKEVPKVSARLNFQFIEMARLNI